MTSDGVNNADDTPFRLQCGADWAAFRSVLSEAGFNETLTGRFTELAAPGGRWDLPLALARSREETAFYTFVRLFLLHRVVPAERVRTALGTFLLEPLIETGLFKETAQGVQAACEIHPYGDLLILNDIMPDLLEGPAREDYVVGVGQATMLLSQFTPRSPVGSVLDVGAGSGFQSLHAAPHADRVVATDLSRRALNFAALSTEMNGRTNIEFREGSLFEPVEGEQFDLIVTNPPFAISPETRYVYRDGKGEGDAVSEQIVRTAAGFLNENGIAVMVINWGHETGDNCERRVLGWLAGNGCDSWLMNVATASPLDYAISWLMQSPQDEPDSFERRLDEWMDYYGRLGINYISLGVLLLRKRSGVKNWRRCETVNHSSHLGPKGEQIERILAGLDRLESLPDPAELLNLPLKLVDEHRMEYALHAENGGWTPQQSCLRLTCGFGNELEIDQPAAALAASLDGTRRLSACAEDLAQKFNLELDEVIPFCVNTARHLVENGFVVICD